MSSDSLLFERVTNQHGGQPAATCLKPETSLRRHTDPDFNSTWEFLLICKQADVIVGNVCYHLQCCRRLRRTTSAEPRKTVDGNMRHAAGTTAYASRHMPVRSMPQWLRFCAA